MIRIDFVTDLGAKVAVDVEDETRLLAVQRQYGRLGWTSGEIPAGGYQFPLDNAEDFDWSLIGARKWVNPEGEEMIIHKGLAYRRRDLEAVDSRKLTLPKAVKYSRGARGTDPEHVREVQGEFSYVTLVFFRGGRRQDRYAAPQNESQVRPAQTQVGQPQTGQIPAPRPRPAPAAVPRPTVTPRRISTSH